MCILQLLFHIPNLLLFNSVLVQYCFLEDYLFLHRIENFIFVLISLKVLMLLLHKLLHLTPELGNLQACCFQPQTPSCWIWSPILPIPLLKLLVTFFCHKHPLQIILSVFVYVHLILQLAKQCLMLLWALGSHLIHY